MSTHRRTSIGRAGSPTGRSPLGLRPGRPRRHAPAASPPERRCPKRHTRAVLPGAYSSTALRITGMAASRSPRLALSRATHNSVTGTSEGELLAQPEIAGLHHQLQPAVTVGRGVPIQQRASPTRTRPRSVRHRCWPLRRSAPPPRSRAPRSHRPEAPRSASRNRRSRRRHRRGLPGCCVGPSRRRRGGPGAIRDGPATTEQCRAMPTRPPAVIRHRSRRPWRGRRRPGR